ncbi:hypothetical protein B0J14DRAFT_65650 [Halenospora varia]|nr:hypothetical protein B0J14DRAFT_65650 [Halenospora varia]
MSNRTGKASQRDLPSTSHTPNMNHHGLFWIKGKPAAGKSTIMKFICGTATKTDVLFRHVSIIVATITKK